MKVVWIAFCVVAGMIGELVLGAHGVACPLFLVVSFYFTVVLGWRSVLGILACGALLLDLAYGRSFPATLVVLGAVQFLASVWRRHGSRRYPLSQAVPGLAVGALSGVGMVVLVRIPGMGWGPGLLRDSLGVLTASLVGAALLTPMVCALLDRAARGMALPRYGGVRHERIEAYDG